MSQKFGILVSGLGLLAAAILPLPLANAQAPVSLQEQLAAQYKLAKMGSDSSGWSVVEEGTLLSIQKGGIKGSPYKTSFTRFATFQDGTVHAAADPASGKVSDMKNKLCGVFKKCPTTPDAVNDESTTKLFAKGDKVYPTKIDVSLDKDTVTLGIVACDTCNKTDPPTYNKANVVFVFPKGSLAAASAGTVEDTIGQLLSISTDDANQGDSGQQGDQQQGGDQGGQQQAGQQQGGQQQPTAQEQPPAEPASIDKGMTTDQVQSAMGKPDKIVNLGTKTIYYYKDMKVIFLSGKVSDVQ
ncbi:MAG: hypothetical protein WBV55_16055 [Candidatus Sulfotelmatobacter sp.]